MFEQLLEAARKLDDASLLPDAPELLLSGRLVKKKPQSPHSPSPCMLIRPVLAVPGEFSLDDIRSLATERQDKSVSSAPWICPFKLLGLDRIS